MGHSGCDTDPNAMLILRGPRKNLELMQSAEGWKDFLADPEKHWKDGRSAKMLAEAWEAAAPGLPGELTRAFADESFGPMLSGWLREASPGKLRRLAFLQETLGLEETPAESVRYQLLHRTASPMIEARRLRARYAAMVVHSFSAQDAGLADYRAFGASLGLSGDKDRLERADGLDDPELWVGWVGGDGAGAAGSTARVVAARERPATLPRLVAHADWGSDPKKRWLCVAELEDGGAYRIRSPEPVGDAQTLLRRLKERAGEGPVVAGFDFPIGVPSAWAERAGVNGFLDLLPKLGEGRWADFYTAASSAEDISLTRPFYPMRPGGTKQRHLTEALGVEDMTELLRMCDHATETRGAACPIFWTLGGKQVGKAALLGWREVLVPALNDPAVDISVWPFDGDLAELTSGGDVVVAETYPAEACVHIGIKPPGRGWSKRRQEGRAAQQGAILDWAQRRPAHLTDELSAQVVDGFGPSKDAEDPFDALLGLLSMVEVVLGYRGAGAPDRDEVRTVEGWILGQEA